MRRLSSKQGEGLIAVNVFLNIEYDNIRINENLNFNFRTNIYVREMIKEIIDHFNLDFNEKNIKVKLKPEGLGYELIDNELNDNKIKKPFSKNLKLCDLKTKMFKLKYDPQDIMINFEKKNYLIGCFACPFC